MAKDNRKMDKNLCVKCGKTRDHHSVDGCCLPNKGCEKFEPSQVIDTFHDQRDYYIMMELVKKLKDELDEGLWSNAVKVFTKGKIDSIFGEDLK